MSLERAEKQGQASAKTDPFPAHPAAADLPVTANHDLTRLKSYQDDTVSGLEPGVRGAMESALGGDLSGVRIRTGRWAQELSRDRGAAAIAVGDEICIGSQVPDAQLRDPRGELLAHELTHVLQRRKAPAAETDGITSPHDGPEQEAARNGWLIAHGWPIGAVRYALSSEARTPTSDLVEHDLSYALNDWEVTPSEERRILDALERDTDISGTVRDLQSAGMLAALFDRLDEPGCRRRLLHVLGRGLDPAARTMVEPRVRALGAGAELQFNLGRWGVTSGAPAFNPAPLEARLVATARTSRTGHTGGHLTAPFSGVGATGVTPVTRYVGTFYTSPGVPQIPLTDQALMAAGDQATLATYSNPVGSLPGYLASLSATDRRGQAELMLRRPISSTEQRSYEGNVPSRAQVMLAAGRAHRIEGALVAAIILAEQRDQSQAEDAADFQGATSLLQRNSSVGLGQVVVSTAQRNDLFADLVSDSTRRTMGVDRATRIGHDPTARLLASDEYNIFATARYIRKVADLGSTMSAGALPQTVAAFPGVDFAAFARDSGSWPSANIRALGSEYTSRPWDDTLVVAWGDFVFEAYQDVKATGLL
ncbi:DUF4157 domain-containing protein [Microbacterium sp. ARD31]|uniref:eCIS core domain-containing protein n=1 Tax=Microbacterium sp. ARD31 TaxID=2962576 RepID=UPI00288123BC|nr:DUF4157 domain-containing protein [Microbacterium sp. ARD31]MDT0184484.1 DUF4157 domain-containing protein [Microbacterium sp. ARD31]